jgi:DNA repair protein RadC
MTQPNLPGIEDGARKRLRMVRESACARTLASPLACNNTELLGTLIGNPSQAETLLAKYGTWQSVARANAAELNSVLTPGACARVVAAAELGRRLQAPDTERPQISSPADAFYLLQPVLMHREQEYLYVLLLDVRNRVIGQPIEVYHGSLDTSLIRVGEVFREAVRTNAASIIVAHNHPSGDPSPSPEDVAVTRAVVEAGKLLDIACLDHLVLGQGKFVSLKERGLGFNV